MVQSITSIHWIVHEDTLSQASGRTVRVLHRNPTRKRGETCFLANASDYDRFDSLQTVPPGFAIIENDSKCIGRVSLDDDVRKMAIKMLDHLGGDV